MTTATTPRLSTGRIGLNVSDLDRSADFGILIPDWSTGGTWQPAGTA
ncbi:hypothetical protein ACW2Q0_19580 [Nocardia sp. R16R-3T]